VYICPWYTAKTVVNFFQHPIEGLRLVCVVTWGKICNVSVKSQHLGMLLDWLSVCHTATAAVTYHEQSETATKRRRSSTRRESLTDATSRACQDTMIRRPDGREAEWRPPTSTSHARVPDHTGRLLVALTTTRVVNQHHCLSNRADGKPNEADCRPTDTTKLPNY